MSYNSLQAMLQKQMNHGLQYQVSYTYSKCMSDSTGYYGAWNNALSASAYWQNVYDQRSEWAPCYYDATHVLSAYAVYDLPFGLANSWPTTPARQSMPYLADGQISPIVSFRTGFPLSRLWGADMSGTFGRGSRANCNGIPDVTPDASIDGCRWYPVVHQ